MTPGSVVVGYLDGGTWSACFGLSFRDLLLSDAGGSRRIVRPGGKEVRVPVSTGHVAAGRNRVVRDFLGETDAEWLLMLDTDMGFAPDTVDRLVASADPQDRPVVGALCFAAKRTGEPSALHAEQVAITPTLYEWAADVDGAGFRPVMDYPRDQVVRVAGTGAACLLIHRSALERVADGSFGAEWFDPMPATGPARWFSEDLSFCLRLRDCGIPLHVDTSVKTAHHKGVFFLDEDAFDRQQALVQLAEVHLGARR